MPPAARHPVHAAHCAVRVRRQGVDEGRLADTGVADQHRELAAQRLRQPVGAAGAPAPGHDHVEVEVRVGADQRPGVGQVRFGQDQDGAQPRLVGGHEAAVDHARARRRVGQGDDDAHERRVRHDRLLAPRVGGVLQAAAQHGGALLDPDDARQGPGRARQVSREAHPVAHDDAAAPDLLGAHPHDAAGAPGARPPQLGCEHHLVAAAVDADDGADGRGGPVGAVLRPGARALRGAHPHPRVVRPRVPAPHQGSRPPASAPAHIRANPGSVFDVHSMSRTPTPAVVRPRTAPKAAILWSS